MSKTFVTVTKQLTTSDVTYLPTLPLNLGQRQDTYFTRWTQVEHVTVTRLTCCILVNESWRNLSHETVVPRGLPTNSPCATLWGGSMVKVGQHWSVILSKFCDNEVRARSWQLRSTAGLWPALLSTVKLKFGNFPLKNISFQSSLSSETPDC